MKCDLCHKPTRHTLCNSCKEAITRVMPLSAFTRGRAVDRAANQQQARILRAFAKGAN